LKAEAIEIIWECLHIRGFNLVKDDNPYKIEIVWSLVAILWCDENFVS
jgi:hypothetical protein